MQVDGDLDTSGGELLFESPLWADMQEANRRIFEDTRRADDLYYADTASPMLTDAGRPNPDLFVEDGLHLNEHGYAVWKKVLLPYLERLVSHDGQE